MAAATLTLATVFAGAVYLRGWLHRRPIPVWRASSFLLGLLATWAAVASPIASLDSHMLTAHMIQHLLLMTIAPPLIWLGEPVITAWPAGWPFPRRLGGLLGHPAFCWIAAAAALVAWHVPAIFRLGMQSSTWHFIEHASFLTTGLLFWWPVIQPGRRSRGGLDGPCCYISSLPRCPATCFPDCWFSPIGSRTRCISAHRKTAAFLLSKTSSAPRH